MGSQNIGIFGIQFDFFGKISTVFTGSKLKFAYYWFLLGTDFTDFHDKKE